jgi:hypothetical protein
VSAQIRAEIRAKDAINRYNGLVNAYKRGDLTTLRSIREQPNQRPTTRPHGLENRRDTASTNSRLSSQAAGVTVTHELLKAVWQSVKRCGRACHFWSEQPSRFAPKRPRLKLLAQILTLLFADNRSLSIYLLVIHILKDG